MKSPSLKNVARYALHTMLQVLRRHPLPISAYSATGGALSVASGRCGAPVVSPSACALLLATGRSYERGPSSIIYHL